MIKIWRVVFLLMLLCLPACDPLNLAQRQDVDYTGTPAWYPCSYHEAEGIVTDILHGHGARRLREQKQCKDHDDCMFYFAVVNTDQPQGGVVIVDIKPADVRRRDLTTVVVKSGSYELSDRMFLYEFSQRLLAKRGLLHANWEQSYSVAPTW